MKASGLHERFGFWSSVGAGRRVSSTPKLMGQPFQASQCPQSTSAMRGRKDLEAGSVMIGTGL